MGQFNHPHCEDDMVGDYAFDPSIYDHLGPPKTTHQKI
jgi:hypothetical protein